MEERHWVQTPDGRIRGDRLNERDLYNEPEDGEVGLTRAGAQITAPGLEAWELEDAARHWLKLAAHRAGLHAQPVQYDQAEYLAAVEASSLKPKIKRTIVATARTANRDGVTAVDRATIALDVGYRDPDTITDHWKTTAEHGFMASRRRFNNSKVHVMTLPHWPRDVPAGGVLPWPDKDLADPAF